MKKPRGPGGVVYSTDPNFNLTPSTKPEPATLPAAHQNLRIRLETKHRAGKAMTVVTGFVGAARDLEALGKQLKGHCGTGGSAKDGEILIQGDQRDKVMHWLADKGYLKAKRV